MTSQARIKQIDIILAGYKAGPFYINMPSGETVHEWSAFLMAKKQKIKLMADKFGSTGKSEHVIERGLLDMPATLYSIFKRGLSEDDWKWFDSVQGKTWIAKHYKELRFGETM